MRLIYYNSLVLLGLLVSTFLGALAAPSAPSAPRILHTIERHEGQVTGRLIVTLKPSASKSRLFNQLRLRHNATSVITHEWDAALHGFAGMWSCIITVCCDTNFGRIQDDLPRTARP